MQVVRVPPTWLPLWLPRLGVLVVLALPAACTSSGSSSGDGDDGGNGGDGGGGETGEGGSAAGGDSAGGATGGMAGAPDGQEVGACGPMGPAPIRRLSRTEYAGTVRGLFPKVFAPGSDGVWRLDDHIFQFQRPGQTSSLRLSLFREPAEDTLARGFDNRAENLSPTALHVERFGDTAAYIAEHVFRARATGEGDDFVGCSEKTLDCGKSFIDSFGSRAFRRPLTEAERADFEAFFEKTMNEANFDAAVILTLEVFLQAPQFLYRAEFGDDETEKSGLIKLTPYETASRLSYLLWSSMPDEDLFTAAREGKLSKPEELKEQARRMVKDPRFSYMAVEFFRQWGDFERIFSETCRRRPGFPNLGPGHSVPRAYRTAARAEMQRFVEWLMTEGDGSVKSLLTSRKSWGNAYLEKLYATGVPADQSDANLDASTWKELTLNPAQRSGYLTRALFNWTYSRFDTPSPPLRGAFVIEKLLCGHFPPPPADALSLKPPAPTGPTNRELFEANVKARTDCPACHTTLDGVGFGFEHYNEVGMYRSKDSGRDVNAKGDLQMGTDVDGPFNGAVELSERLGESATVRHCMLQQWYEYGTGRQSQGNFEEEGLDVCRLKALDEVLVENGGDMREALIAFVGSPDFVWRPVVKP